MKGSRMEPPWNQVYTRDVPPDFDEERKREDRKERIKPYWDDLVVDKEPKVNKDILTRLMHDLKEEGNGLFKDGHFDIAWMHYRNAIFVVRILENRYYHEVEKEFLSSLFSNRAFCCLKKSMYTEAVQDCESAIQVHSKNIKAYYRQAQAYKHLKKYSHALKSAQKGDEIQPSSALKELIEELEPLLEKTDKSTSLKSKSHVDVSTKESVTADHSSTNNNSVPKHDNEWLTGTNVGVTKKHLETKTKMPTKKNKKVKTKSAPVATVRQHVVEEDSDSDEHNNNSLLEDDQQFAHRITGVKQTKFGSSLLNGRSGSIVGGLDIVSTHEDDSSAWSFPHDSDDIAEWKSNKPKTSEAKMGLDNFSPTSARGSDGGDSESTSHTTSNPSSGRSSRTSQSPAKFPPTQSKQQSQTQTANDVIPPIIFPFNDEFEFKLACRHCFAKIGEGVKGYRYVNASHMCLRDVLILKKRGVPGMNWVKIRSRPDSKGSQFGPYKICTQFAQGKPCKVGEENCTFPHHQPEMRVWLMDREGRFSLGDFMRKCAKYKIDDTSKLESVNAKNRYIPGLNYVGQKNIVHTLQIPESSSDVNEEHTHNTAHSNMSRQMVAYSTNHNTVHPPTNRYQYKMDPYMNGNFNHPSSFMPYHETGAPPDQQWIRETPGVLRNMEPSPVEDVVQLDNPLAETHTYMIVCLQCFKPTNYPGVYSYLPCLHKCEETVLAMKLRDNLAPWMRIRERKNHRDFPGNYILCRSISFKNQVFCQYGEDNCSFAHNEIEKILWTLEKDGKFNIMEFIMQNRKHSAMRGFSLKEIMDKHGGHFEFICRSCYYGSPAKITPEGEENNCSGDPAHSWRDYRIMAHFGPSGEVTLINPRGFLHKTAFFKICKWLKFCRNRVNAECRFAHSMVERDVWMLERDCGIEREEIIRQVDESRRGGAGTELPSTDKLAITLTDGKPTQEEEESDTDVCPFVVIEVCETCWKKGQRTLQEGGKDRCQKGHTNWTRNIVYTLSPSNKELRPLPRKIPSGNNFIVCKYIREGKKCGYTGIGPCQFAHSTEELEAWKYMCVHEMTKREELAEKSKETQKARSESTKSKISGQSVVSVSAGSVGGTSGYRKPALPVGNVNAYYCHYCGVSCNSQKQWDEHCASEKHNFNVNSDREHQWNYRQPPWTAGRSYELCFRHSSGKKCQYSNVPEMYNLCRYAHSQEELDEWKERYEWRQMKREMARQEKVFSYMDQLLDKYQQSQSSIKVICEEMDGVDINVLGQQHLYREDKHSTYIWTFEVTAKRRLQRVCLLHNKDRLHFTIYFGGDRSIQIAQGEHFAINTDRNGNPYYKVQVRFTGGMYGSFFQWVIFDFGGEPVLAKKLTVEVGNQASHEKVRSLREQLKFDRWTSQTREIVRHEQFDVVDESLMSKYKEPSSSEAVVTQTTVVTELNRHNYVPKMHTLLELEEMTRHQIISSYNLCTTIECLKAIEEYVHVYAKEGELFARVPLLESLSEDTDAGKLILTSVRTVLLAPLKSTDKIVYEASIVREENFNYDGRGKEFIYLCLSPHCVRRLNLAPGTTINVEIQFQMNRLFFCRMHYAVDQLKNSDIVFPDVTKINPLRNEKHNLRISSSVLNPDQMSAVRHIIAERTGYTPPFVMFGPFGTGKTETIAQAAMVLLKETKNTRILICAQSNSAADLFIIKHLDPFLKKYPSVGKLRRVYFKERRVYTVDPIVKKYCLIHAGDTTFLPPTAVDIEQHRVVIVTVTSSLLLNNIDLRGKFSHIFVDEAAQTLECEALMPLSLATERTCVVLAGDHNQISPKVYSNEAKTQKFHMSLLERLYNFYDSNSSLINESSPLNIPLSINYRTKMEILRFISSSFYGGPDKLKSEGNIPSVVGITPLMFYTVQGREVQDKSSISYYNRSEVSEIVERVDDVYKNWPAEWGRLNARDIGVVTPYYDQVIMIRKELRLRDIALKDVMVERVQGVQGKEFRAMFISTVRTRHLIDTSEYVHNASECDGDWGDFGFLSDAKLLNTALTRAQSLVVVVGDPVALCAIGECLNIWRTYLKHCHNMGSLYPEIHNYESIKQQVHHLLNSPDREKLLQLANERQMADFQPHIKPETETNVVDSSTIEKPAGQQSYEGISQSSTHVPDPYSCKQTQPPDGASSVNSKPVTTPDTRNKPPPPLSLANFGSRSVRPPAPLTFLNQKKAEKFIELGEKFVLDPDDVINQLARIVVNEKTPANVDKVDKNLIKIGEEYNHAVLYYNTSRVLPSSAAPDNVDVETARSLLSNPEKYLHCKLHRNGDVVYANNIGSRNVISQVPIPNRWVRGQANINDEVVVEIVRMGPEIHGKVVGILRRAVYMKDRYIVCSVGDTSGIMVPLDTHLPPMFNLTTEMYMDKNMAGNVSVYKFTKSTNLRFSHFEKIMPEDPNKLFVVKFVTWNKNVGFPLCLVVGVISVGLDISRGIQILDLQYQVSKTTNTELINEIQNRFPENFQLTSDLLNNRDVDLRSKWCFSIDQPSIDYSERAFSIDETEDGNYLVGVHVSDVSTFLVKDSRLDLDVSDRATAVNPVSGEPIRLLPARLATQICSFTENEDRLAVSVLMVVQKTGEVKTVNVQKSIVNVKKKFSYKEAEDALHDPNAHEDYWKSCVFVLYEFSRIWRKERLGNASSYHENFYEKIAPLIQQLVEELVIMTEYHIASILYNRYKLVTPLCIQAPPPDPALNTWRQEHAADAINSIALTKPFLNPAVLETCTCCLACTHTVNYIRQSSMAKREYMEVMAGTWDTLQDAVIMGDFNYMQNAIVAAENHPQLAVALHKLDRLQQTPRLTCSSNVLEGYKSHYNINRPVYTHFCEPLSRFMDIVVQRMLIALLENSPCPYTQKEIDAICEHYSVSHMEKLNYEKQVFLLHLSSALLSHPLVLQPVVESISSDSVSLCVAAIPSLSSLQLDIPSLGACEYVRDPSTGTIVVKWRERLYDLAVLNTDKPIGASTGLLNPDRFIYKIPAFKWQTLLIAIREQDEDTRFMKLRQAIEMVRKQVITPAQEGSYLDEVTLEMFKHDKPRRCAEFSLEIRNCQVLQVQLSAKVNNSILSPYIQLLSLTPRLSICLQHRQNPLCCFAPTEGEGMLDSACLNMCTVISTYEKYWSVLNNMEAVTRAVTTPQHVTIHNVTLTWTDHVTSKLAQFSLPISYLASHRIKIYSVNHLKHLQTQCNQAYFQAYFCDYVCLRYSNLMLADDPALPDSLAAVLNNAAPVTWVGHGKITNVAVEGSRMVFDVELLQSDVPLPTTVIQKQPCTVELMEKTERDVNILSVQRSISDCSQLAKSIILRQIHDGNVLHCDGGDLLQAAHHIQPVLNQQQDEAVMKALHHQFTVVHSAVGTGKTQVAVKLAYMMNLRNKGAGRGQVLLCGSSETAVDGIMEMLAKLQNNCPRVIRVYSEEVERIVHPHPHDISSVRGFNHDSVISNYSTASLHDLARSSGLPVSKHLTEFDTLFSLYPDDISEDQVDEYRDLMLTAESVLLREAEIIVCTCSTSALPKLCNHTNIRQIIIDDGNACTEPECIIPIITHKNADQVVMFGDTKQLDPVVMSQTARRLGLVTPLMNSYLDTAVKLTVQYRVHEDMMDFPSRQMYDGRLLCGTLIQRQPSVLNWPGGRGKPSVFCNLVGLESSIPPALQLTNNEAYNNLAQADFAVRVVGSLTARYQTSPSNIAVISSTKGQALTIREKLKSIGQDVISLTVLESQGKEYDYVILSTVRAIPVQKIEVIPDEQWRLNYLGNLCDKKQTIVALTRARKGLIIVGNRQLLCCDKLWNSLLINYDMGKKLVSAENFLQTMAM